MFTLRKKIVRITEPNHQSRQTGFNIRQIDETGAEQIINDLSIIYDVEAISSSTLPTNKLQRLQLMQSMFQQGIIRDPASVIQYLDVEDVDSLLQRESLINQYQQALEQCRS